MEFIEKAEQLNDLSSYPQLVERCKLIGAEISKVVFRGYFASPKLQQMHDDAIEARTQLKMQVKRWIPDVILLDHNVMHEC